MSLGTPLVLVNYKVYAEASGERAVAITRDLVRVAKDYSGVTVAVSPGAFDLAAVAAASDLPVLAQHVDALKAGSGTGWLLADAAKQAGAVGSLINHAEHRLNIDVIDDTIHRLKHLGMARVVCSNNLCTTKAIAAMRPDFVAIEPPELIGGTVSVTSANPDIVADAVKFTREIDPRVKVLCGAGVKTGDDVAKALELGAAGVLLASGVTKAKDAGKALDGLLAGIR